MQPIYINGVRGALMGALLSFAGCVAAAPGGDQTEGEVAPLSIVEPAACKTDADCRAVPDYCAECACVALGVGQKLPECFGEELKCVLNPCAEHVPMCIEGRCVAESGALR